MLAVAPKDIRTTSPAISRAGYHIYIMISCGCHVSSRTQRHPQNQAYETECRSGLSECMFPRSIDMLMASHPPGKIRPVLVLGLFRFPGKAGVFVGLFRFPGKAGVFVAHGLSFPGNAGVQYVCRM